MAIGKNPGGRPPKPSAEQRTATIRFRVTFHQMQIIKTRATGCNLTLSEYARRMVLNGKVVPPIGTKLLSLAAELTREKNNLNQIAKAQNAAGAQAKAEALENIIWFYNLLIEKIRHHDR